MTLATDFLNSLDSTPANQVPMTSDSTTPAADTGVSWGGFLSKAMDTAVDVAGLYGAAVIGSKYPTGQVSPDAAASQKQADATTQAQANAAAFTKYLPWILGGVGLLVVGALALGVARRR